MDWDKHLPTILAWGGSVVTGVFTLLGVWFANRSSLKQLTVKLAHDNDKEAREVERSRLEELYSLIGRWANEVVMHHLMYRRVMEGDLTYNQALDLTIKSGVVVDANRMFTVAELYFPSAHDALQKLKKLRDDAASIQTDFKESYKLGQTTSADHARLLTSVLEKFNAATDAYQKAISAHAQDI